MKKTYLVYYIRISAVFIWLILTGFCIFNHSALISSVLLFIPIPIVVIHNLLMFGDLNIFRNSLDRSITFMEKRIEEISKEKRFGG
ncbi:hypothetical protein [uncultured Flavobacterium sp.]|uniref:hypothetical protein n=1 Tax=uncultured Flavobacterium sp. TaxID=165435 RepID=UPI002596AFCF|nr:hypothetical protein [uncultured Flavobacterium sp.]